MTLDMNFAIDALARSAIKDGLDPDCLENFSFLDDGQKKDVLKEAVMFHGDDVTDERVERAFEEDDFNNLAKKIADRMRQLA